MPPDDPPSVSPLVGLGTLADLKAAVLPAGLVASTGFDSQITAIGRSVAAQFDAFTNRTLARNVGIQWEGTADRFFVCLPCYPVEAVSMIELRFYGQTDNGTFTGNPVWNDYTSFIIGTMDQLTGVLDLQYNQGTVMDRLRVTYTGGYWLPNTPLPDLSAVAPMPDTALPLPQDLTSAWTLQVGAELQTRDVLGTAAVRDEKEDSSSRYSSGLKLLPAVLQILNGYRRMAIA